MEKILETWMNNILENASYNANESPKLCAQIATEIRNRVEMLEFDRLVFFPKKYVFQFFRDENFFKFLIIIVFLFIDIKL